MSITLHIIHSDWFHENAVTDEIARRKHPPSWKFCTFLKDNIIRGTLPVTLSKIAEMFSEIASSHVTLFVVDS